MFRKLVVSIVAALAITVGVATVHPGSAFAGGCSTYSIETPTQPYKNANGAWLIDSNPWSWTCGASNFRVEGRAEILVSGSWQFLADSPRWAPSSTGYYSGGNKHTGEFIGYEVAYPGTLKVDVCNFSYRIHYDISFANGSAGYSDNSPVMNC